MRARGFTLLEVLIAISIFALIGIASYRVLTSVMQTDERLVARQQQMRNVNRALWILQQDIEQLVKRNVRAADGAISTTDNYLLVNNDAPLPLQLTRGGRSNPLGLPRSAMQRVAYAVDHHPDYEKTDSPFYHDDEHRYLLRYSWPMLDGAGAKEKAQVQILLPDIDKMTVSVLSTNGPEPLWPPQTQRDPPLQPLALQLELISTEGESLKHSYQVW